MRVTDLRIDRFGDWTGVDLRDLALGLNVMFFPDAATKTALVQFVPSVLYGFSESVRQRFLHSAADGGPSALREYAAGGTVALESSQGRYRVTRHDAPQQGGQLTVHTADGHLCPADTLHNLLHGIDRGTYRETFVFPVRDFEGLGQLQGVDLQTRFAPYGAVSEPLGIAQTRSGLAKLRADAWRSLPQSLGEHLVTCRRLRQELQTRIAEQRGSEAEMLRQQSQLQESLPSLQTQASQLRAAIEAILGRLAEIERQPLPSAPQVAAVKSPDDEWQRRLARLDARSARLNQLLRKVDAKRSKLRARIAECAIDEVMWRDSQHAVWFARRSESFRKLEQQAQELHRTVVDIARQSESQGRVRTQELMSLEPMTQSLLGGLESMSSELRSFESRAYQRDLLVAGERRLRKLQSKLARRIRRLAERRQRLLCRCEAGIALPARREPAVSPRDAAAAAQAASQALAAREAELARLRGELEKHRAELRDIEARIQQQQRQLASIASQLEELRNDRTIADKRCVLASAEAALEQATAQWKAAAVAGVVLENTAAQCSRSSQPELLSLASEYLHQLSAGRMSQVRARVGEGGLEIQMSDQRTVSLAALDGPARRALLFCLRLAAVTQQAQRGVHLPILVDDVLGQFDSATCIAAARLLVQLSQRGYQVLYFTCRQEIAVLFEELQVPSRRVSWRGERLAVPTAVDPTDDGWTETRPAAPAARSVQQAETIAVVSSPALAAPSIATTSSSSRLPQDFAPGNQGRFLLGLSSPVAEIPSMDGESARRLRELGVRTAGDLLASDAVELEQRLAHPALRAARLVEWQAEAILACRVPLLNRQDLKLLLACGISQPEELAALTSEQLLQRLDSRASEHAGLAKSRDYVAARASHWIVEARQARSLPHTLSSNATVPVPHFSSPRSRAEEAAVSSQAATTLPLVSGKQSSPEFTATTSLPATTTPAMGASVATSQSAEQLTMPRFYLSKSSSVGEAPSIGPKTAKRLNVLGIYSVADLLDADAEETAGRLGLKWINAATIRDWQAQATLVCRVPMLRGHDAQLLVATGYREPEQFAHLNPRQLLNLLQPLVESSEGERILRGASAPDLEEVSNWIRWAGQARAMRVA